MRTFIVLMAATALSACGGSSPNSAGSVAVGGGTTTSGSTSNAQSYAEFKTPTVARTYSGIGGSQVFSYTTDDRTATNGATGLTGFQGQQASTYAGNASTVRSSNISIAYDPRDAIFTLQVTDPRSGAATRTRFQDPASRTNFGGATEPQWGTANFANFAGVGANPNIRFVQAGDGNPLSPYGSSGSGFVDPGNNSTPPSGITGSSYQATTFFYEVPGTNTNFVTIAGYLRNDMRWQDTTAGSTPISQTFWKLERGAFAYGIQTDTNAVPKTGSGTYTGSMIGTLVFNPTIDGTTIANPGPGALPTYFQWMSGTATTTVNFANNQVGLTLNGVVGAAQFDRYTTPQQASLAAGTTFTATGSATINLVTTGGFTGSFSSARFGSTTNGSNPVLNIAGSSIDGAFYGPAAEEVGGGFRIVGGVPDQRVDIIGAFTGKKP
jgi:C-lobe and N-lobe beta barrels of Tf-binding protein B